ncbi:uncharacterized protein LOC131887635 [Tigriopus californicus]|uniref:uncharacterized protein LOC131887635 n=1 Tax=Tigriopus californicus TaxID=6832 RepID=UPI0027DA18F0|nr:uncharacterized protein LOC131887635 [Tigriopus californicus]
MEREDQTRTTAVRDQLGSSTALDVARVKKPTSLLAAVIRKINEIEGFMKFEANLGVVEELFRELEQKVSTLKIAVEEEELRSGTLDSDRIALSNWWEEKSAKIERSKENIQGWIRRTQDSWVKPSDSVSVASSGRSRTSGVSNASSAARVELARKKAEAVAEKHLQTQLRKLRADKRKAQYEREDRERRAQRAADEEEEGFRLIEEEIRSSAQLEKNSKFSEELDVIEGVKNTSKVVKGKGPECTLTPSYRSQLDIPSKVNEDHSSMSRQITLLAEIAERSHLPRSEPRIYDGSDPISYKSFIQSFDQLIATRTSSNAEKLHYLEKYTNGNAKDLVRSCFNLNPEEGYREARRLLHQKFGNEFLVCNGYLERLRNWPSITIENRQGLEELSIFLLSCRNFMKEANGLVQLNGPTQMQEIIMKLPYQIRVAWRNHAFARLEGGSSVSFEDLTSFVAQQSKLISLPIFGDLTDKCSHKGTKLCTDHAKITVSFATGASNTVGQDDRACLACKKSNHALEGCFFFAKRPLEDKLGFLQDRRLCYGCLKPGHQSWQCIQRFTCQKCNRKHPTCLHNDDRPYGETDRENQENNQRNELNLVESTSLCCLENTQDNFKAATGQTKSVALAIIPVIVRVQGSKKEVITYAGLDNFSIDCFVTSAIVDELGISGPKRTISLTTMECKGKSVNTQAISGLEIMDLSRNETMGLPVVFTKDELPISKDDVLTREDCEQFDYLADVPFEFVEATVGLMLGANAPQALKPLEVVGGDEGRPYATRHKFGWALNGPIVKETYRGFTKVNRTEVEVKSIERDLKKMYNQDFLDNGEDGFGPSVEDQRWSKKVNDWIRRGEDGHYCIGLPLRSEFAIVPDNRSQALSRIRGITRRLKSDHQFRADYTGFMSMMIEKKFAERVPPQDLHNRRRWYIVHHGVYHKQKGTIRVVFDCSLKYGGVSLNDMLLPGPDLSNNLLGVLLRFRQGKVAIMGDIEKMFYQVRVPIEDKDLLRYFWYPDGDFDQEPIEFRLKVHVFGAISSPSCANYALRRAACDSERSVDSKAIDVVKRDFYVDDLLTSVDTSEGAQDLVHMVRKICSHGRFNLTQIISNDRSVMEKLPLESLNREVQDLDLERDTSKGAS